MSADEQFSNAALPGSGHDIGLNLLRYWPVSCLLHKLLRQGRFVPSPGQFGY